MAAWKLRMLLWQHNLSVLAAFIFLLTFLLKSASKSTFFCFDVEIRFWSCRSLQFVEPVCVILLRFATHCLQIAVEWLRQGSSLWQLHAYYYCVLQLKVVNRIVMAAWKLRRLLWQQNVSILAVMIFLLKFLFKTASKSSFFRFGVEIRFWSCKSLQFLEPVCVVLLHFATHCLQIAVEWLRQGSSFWQLHAQYYCVFSWKLQIAL